jgi:hypothetical protein
MQPILEETMQLDATTSAILVRIVKTTIDATKGANKRKLSPTNDAQLETVPTIRACAAMSATRTDCMIPTSEQRRAARAIAEGKITTLRSDVLETLMRRDLLKYDGQSLVLTDVGRALSALQTQSVSR